jgi:hypothetical protein
MSLAHGKAVGLLPRFVHGAGSSPGGSLGILEKLRSGPRCMNRIILSWLSELEGQAFLIRIGNPRWRALPFA